MALDIKLSTLETWTGSLVCDRAIQRAFAERPDVLKRMADAHFDGAGVDMPADASRVQIRPLTARDIAICMTVADRHEPGARREIAYVEEAVRRALLWISDLPDVRPGLDGYPISALEGAEAYGSIVAEVSRRAQELGALPKGRPSASGSRSGEAPPSGPAAPATPAPAATDAETPTGST